VQHYAADLEQRVTERTTELSNQFPAPRERGTRSFVVDKHPVMMDSLDANGCLLE